jgi:hypothetical protein
MRWALPIVLAVVAALAVAAVTIGIDSRYEATASVRVQHLFDARELDNLRLLAGLPPVAPSEDTPLLPGGRASLARVEAHTARRLGSASSFEPEDLRVIDTSTELGAASFEDPGRRLKVKAIAESPGRAARLANTYLAEYLRELDRATARLLSGAQKRFRAAATPDLSRVSRPVRQEFVDAADIASALHGGVLTDRLVPAAPPNDSISPRPARDIAVAALIGALLGWLLVYARSATNRSNSSRLPSTIASRL